MRTARTLAVFLAVIALSSRAVSAAAPSSGLAFAAVPPRAPARLAGRSAPARPMGELPKLRMAEGNSNKAVPEGCGIDPATGKICAGDPSLILTTNVVMGDKKKAFLVAASKAVAAGLGKPESFVSVAVTDGVDMLFGGKEDPCALGCCYSLGAINNENNKKVTGEITKLLGEFGIPANRMYINFFDVPRENIGYNGATLRAELAALGGWLSSWPVRAGLVRSVRRALGWQGVGACGQARPQANAAARPELWPYPLAEW
eukprot:CAMPEP_0206245970 /NCGR_PEP_ID=MMETSP0047_2-20121206/18992_1 /ASSEMBLY_ACC=CAM_ASM_000192 /TAXON_ID=195065 /ORGANISM="Chroomonas mesostigmatica_cf, Strain CCMP1168" /LENGTH=258 /DNA_ID=CAMNT_0053671327 /DNA_START=59 /DNA_END=833 /DNA_ORIENTATION=+